MTMLPDKPLRFPGGLQLASNKAQSLGGPIRSARLPRRLYVPLSQHIGEPAEATVKIGDRVLKGQQIARSLSYISAPVHAPTSGIVSDIGKYPVPHPSGLSAECLVIDCDGEDRAVDSGLKMRAALDADPAEIRQKVRDAGIVGLGGAGFPTSVKLNPGPGHQVELLIINAAECEPYISCDEALMCDRPQDVIDGIRIMQHALGARQALIGIEDNMPRAIECLTTALRNAQDTALRVVPVPTLYPAGGEKQLIYALTGREVPSQGLPIDIGMVCHNVGTAAAVARALIHGEPLISRVVTVTGAGIAQPGNLEVRIGTPIADIVEQCGGYTADVARLLMGGPMMGIALHTDQLPVIKTTNCILAASRDETPDPRPALPCIRCGKCADVCPASLLPQQLYWYARARDFDKVQDYNLFDCIECGCCAHVCPSHIPLVQYYRFAKTEIWDLERERQKSDLARQRHEFRIERLEREKRELEARRAHARKTPDQAGAGDADAKKAEIAAALQRVKARKAQQERESGTGESLGAEQQRPLTEREPRRATQQDDEA
ncbi:MAG: electron transport complex subunit RsxC [Thiogranum sp.]|nr:electron transport complex subunit RsxC [Thiogranum sp.]